MELIDLINSVIIFLSRTTLRRWLTLLLGSQTVILTVLVFSIYLFLLTLVFVLRWVSLHWILENSDQIVVWISIDFPSNSQRDAPFHRIACDYSHADWHGLRDHLRDIPWENIFKLSPSTASNFCKWVQVGIDVYIPPRAY